MAYRPLKVFIGWDSREVVAYHVLVNSIIRHASGPVSITPLVQSQLRQAGIYTRERGKLESTEFSLTRFLVPYLCDYGDYAVFMDCDQLVRGDVYDLVKIAKADDHRCVWCVQHDYTPTTETKMDGCVQTKYERKNWSSVMVFRNKFCDKLTPGYVNTATGLELHRMHWAGAPENIGKLPAEWNHLVGEFPKREDAKLYHYTIGGPWFRDHQFCDHHDLWYEELDYAFPSLNVPRPKEMGGSQAVRQQTVNLPIAGSTPALPAKVVA